MFKSFMNTRIKTSKSKDEVYDLIEDRLEDLGRTNVSPSGAISITGTNHNGFGYSNDITGRVRAKDDYYTIELESNSKPEIIAWLIAICFFPIGLAIFILPFNAKNEIQNKGNRIIDDLKYDLEDSKA